MKPRISLIYVCAEKLGQLQQLGFDRSRAAVRLMRFTCPFCHASSITNIHSQIAFCLKWALRTQHCLHYRLPCAPTFTTCRRQSTCFCRSNPGALLHVFSLCSAHSPYTSTPAVTADAASQQLRASPTPSYSLPLPTSLIQSLLRASTVASQAAESAEAQRRTQGIACSTKHRLCICSNPKYIKIFSSKQCRRQQRSIMRPTTCTARCEKSASPRSRPTFVILCVFQLLFTH